MFALPASFVSFILQARSNLSTINSGIKGLPRSLKKHYKISSYKNHHLILLNFHATQIFLFLSADSCRHIIQICSFQTWHVSACVCVRVTRRGHGDYLGTLTKRQKQWEATRLLDWSASPRSGVLKCLHSTAQIILIFKHTITEDGKDDNSDNLSSLALIHHQDSVSTAGYKETL